MTIRRQDYQKHDLMERINEYATVRTFLHANKDELNHLKVRLEKGDKSVLPRIKELFDLIEEKNAWIQRNLPIIRSQMAS